MAEFNTTGLKDTELDTVLREIGWDQRFALPELSPAIRALLQEVRQLWTVTTCAPFMVYLNILPSINNASPVLA